jgi:uncharacterized protein YbjQ (UPF0145 family)
MIRSTTELIAGREITEVLGIVKGSTVRTKNVVRDITANLKNIIGGELKGYTEMLNEAREEASDRMVAEAESLGADAIVSIRYQSSSIASGGSEMFCYGTAVKLKYGNAVRK